MEQAIPDTRFASLDEYTQQMQEAERVGATLRAAVMNKMASHIVEQGGVTANISEFALAMHGINRYAQYADRKRRNTDDIGQYDEHERAVEDKGSLLMARMGDEFRPRQSAVFGLIPPCIEYPYRNQPPGVVPNHERYMRQSLRFIVRPRRSGDETGYVGHVVLPLLTSRIGQDVTAHYVKMGTYERSEDALETTYYPSYAGNSMAAWHVGKSAIVAAAIIDYRTTAADDKAFIDALYSEGDKLRGAAETVDDHAWDYLGRQRF